MKKSLFLIAALCFAFVANAQYMPKKMANRTAKLSAITGEEVNVNSGVAIAGNLPKDVYPVGTSTYDLQTNSSVDKRLVKHADGTMSFVWTMGNDAGGGYADRGTGFNYFDGTTWGQAPTARIESTKHGWPSPGEYSGADYVISHTGAGYNFHKNSAFGASDWATTPITAASASAMTWPRTAFGGSYIYAIAAGAEYAGFADMLVFQRSDDGGTTWEDAVLIEGLDTTEYGSFFTDTYAIDAMDNTVAVLSAENHGDIALVKSTNNGDSWTKYVILDYPESAEPYNGTNLDVDGDGLADTFETASHDVAMVLDHNGKAHVVFTKMKFVGDSYFPLMGWDMVYWNEDMAQDVFDLGTDLISPSYFVLDNEDFDTIANVDIDGNDTIDITDAGQYNTGVMAFPTITVTDDNDIVVLFTITMEGEEYLKTDANPNEQNCRHLWCVTRDHVTGLWSEPRHVSDEAGFELNENIYPVSYKFADRVGNNDIVHYVFQNDIEPGTSIGQDADPTTTNYMLYDTLMMPILGVKNVQNSNTASFSVRPNPVQDVMTIESADNAQISIFNVIGSEVLRIENANKSQEINVSTLPEGSYIVRVKTENGVSAQKIIKK